MQCTKTSVDSSVLAVSPWTAVGYYFWNRGDIHKTIEKISEIYESINFKITIPFCSTVWVLQEKELIKPVLTSRMTSLGSVNQHFNISHGHYDSINGVNQSDLLWEDLHTMLARILNHEGIEPLMEKHRAILIPADLSEKICINDALGSFLFKVWGAYTFGPQTDEALYKELRDSIVDYIQKTFHKNPWNRVPFVGKALSYFNHYWHRDEIDGIDVRLSRLLDGSIDAKVGIFAKLYEELLQTGCYTPERVRKIVHDNAFLSFLVYDFIYIVALDYLVTLAKENSPAAADEQRKVILKGSIDRGFLFPFRFRIADEPIGEIAPKDLCVLNLKAAGLYFSYGPRRCPGQGLFQIKFMAMLSQMFRPYSIALADPTEAVEYSENKDIPSIISKHAIVLQKA